MDNVRQPFNIFVDKKMLTKHNEKKQFKYSEVLSTGLLDNVKSHPQGHSSSDEVILQYGEV